jgi:branched-subunit amino acid transport protein
MMIIVNMVVVYVPRATEIEMHRPKINLRRLLNFTALAVFSSFGMGSSVLGVEENNASAAFNKSAATMS